MTVCRCLRESGLSKQDYAFVHYIQIGETLWIVDEHELTEVKVLDACWCVSVLK